MPSIGSTNLHVGAAVAEIEGLYTALRGARDEHHRERILADLAEAGRRLTARTHPTQGNREPSGRVRAGSAGACWQPAAPTWWRPSPRTAAGAAGPDSGTGRSDTTPRPG
ncbi:hypothetical protein O1L55_12580 [Streptomyces albulus]|nr:hypothetical protein [Streptomyces noursei]